MYIHIYNIHIIDTDIFVYYSIIISEIYVSLFCVRFDRISNRGDYSRHFQPYTTCITRCELYFLIIKLKM